jgi:dTMP kinase
VTLSTLDERTPHASDDAALTPRAAPEITDASQPDERLDQERQDAQERLPGRLIIVEGIDGSGKSTQLDLLRKWLVNQGYLVIFSEWNSSPIVKGITRLGKRQQLLSPMSFSLIHAADFASRTYSEILPALQSGAVVLADRYVYTAYARDAVRGVDRTWLRGLYSFAVPPTLAFYFDVPLEEAMRRIVGGRPELKYYEAGLDLGLSSDPYESFRRFQGLIRQEYECVVSEFGLVRMDATESLIHQQQRMRELVRPYLEGALRLPNSAPESMWRGFSPAALGHRQAESKGLAEPDQ